MRNVFRSSRAGLVAAALSAALATGCATTANPDDPLEGYNRAMFGFNEQVDKVVIKPAAQVYEAVLPHPVRTGVGNVLGNLGDPWVALNNLLQGKVAEGMGDLMRFALNSTWGLLGLLDVAGEAGLPKHDEDLGQTLGRWGVGEGAYIVLPFFGPRTVRDAVALPADFIANEPFSIDHVATRNTVLGTRVVHLRSTLLGADRTLEEAALDRYVFVRDFYLEQRRYKVSDGRQERVYEDFDEQSAAPPGGDVDTAAASAVGNLEHADIGASPATAGRRVARQSVQ
ncbi:MULTISPECIES: VacJ family lipoprotein [Thauera]|jgi:phospholipid-binding lipoprotein MlaA|uniref:VacJ family lipoprotein n=2 Tax=Thauera aminoaromatica TaxID=164330 RepID=C4ZLP6_THASP|nr:MULTISPECIES: VacJ family lipoprotein [Thauera]MDA0233651.1 VacJ family lipoprotein [Pseudomonadota bacterium]TMW75245.1 VacJ family lipoprotein [Thauera sp. UPWRP]ACK53658.1 VacJ family lipoprotein [Thauera aminoaromatica]ENO85600.1 VacJ family lipoprotein [Thauera aminoaromatica S2]KIN89867.1 vacJ like lipofamily protein [Thauera sp. SWB20]